MLRFCKICSNLNTYTHTPDRKMIMKCQSCGRIDDNIKDTCIYFNKFVQSSYDIKIDPDQCHDPTLPITDQVPCRNTASCPSNSPGYALLVKEKQEALGASLVPEAVESEFMARGGETGEWILDTWNNLSPEKQLEYNTKAVMEGIAGIAGIAGITGITEITEMVKPRIVFFHYNKEKKLGFICCLCKTYWKN